MPKIEYSNTQDVITRSATSREPTSIRLPEGMSFFSFPKAGTYTVDILPYWATKDPTRANPHCKPGAAHYERTWTAHRNLGLDGRSSYVCPRETFKMPCAVCAHLQHADEELQKAMRGQRRMLFAVIDRGDPEKGVQAWDSPYFKSFGEKLTLKLKSKLYDNFFHLQGGLSLMLTVEEQSIGTGKPFKNVVNIEMVPRKQDYDDSLIDQVPCLDELLIRLEYKQLERVLRGEAAGDAEPVEPIPYSKGKAAEKPQAAPAKAPSPAPAPRKAPEPKVTRGNTLGPADLVEHPVLGQCAVTKCFDTDEGQAVWVRDGSGKLHKEYEGAAILSDSLRLLED